MNPYASDPHPSTLKATPPLVCCWTLPFPTTLSWRIRTHLTLILPRGSLRLLLFVVGRCSTPPPCPGESGLLSPSSFLVDRYASSCLLLEAAVPHHLGMVNPYCSDPHPSSLIATPPLVGCWSLLYPTTLSWRIRTPLTLILPRGSPRPLLFVVGRCSTPPPCPGESGLLSPSSFLVDLHAPSCLLLVAALPNHLVLVNPDSSHPHPSSVIAAPSLVSC